MVKTLFMIAVNKIKTGHFASKYKTEIGGETLAMMEKQGWQQSKKIVVALGGGNGNSLVPVFSHPDIDGEYAMGNSIFASIRQQARNNIMNKYGLN